MKQKETTGNLINIGIDSLEIDIKTEKELGQNKYDFYSPRTKQIVGALKRKQGKEKGYRLNINLPKCIRETNLCPFSLNDAPYLLEINEMLVTQIKNLFKTPLPQLTISTCEVNATAELQNKTNLEPMLNMLAYMFLAHGNKLFICCHGTKSGKRFENLSSLQSNMQVESIKTEQLSNRRMCFKFYNKSLEQNIENKSIIRLENIYNRAGLSFAKTGETLQDFFTIESLRRLFNTYGADYKSYLIDRYWTNSGHPFYKDCITLIYNDLKRTKHPTTTALMNRTIVEFDFAFFTKACNRYYTINNSATQAINRVKNSQELKIHEGVVSDFLNISRNIVYG